MYFFWYTNATEKATPPAPARHGRERESCLLPSEALTFSVRPSPSLLFVAVLRQGGSPSAHVSVCSPSAVLRLRSPSALSVCRSPSALSVCALRLPLSVCYPSRS